jgi:lipopolysaccharide/colanic/teichoic acid biosynthesis glycosyltransferase
MSQASVAEQRRLLGRTPARKPVDWDHAVNAALALFILVFCAPLMVLTALAIYVYDGGPPLFAHRRVGREGRGFRCLKFRSMAVDAESRLERLLASDPAARREWEADHKLRRDPRVTPLGRILRKTSLDELPQLINVLRGEMNLVGPRPVVQAEACKYGHRFVHYCAVRPGITGLWQVSGRNNTSYGRRVALDVLYTRRKSLRLDLAILLRTVPAVLMRDGSY